MLVEQLALRRTDLPLQISAYVVRVQAPVERQDVEAGGRALSLS